MVFDIYISSTPINITAKLAHGHVSLAITAKILRKVGIYGQLFIAPQITHAFEMFRENTV